MLYNKNTQLSFGKYKGTTISNLITIDLDYLCYCIRDFEDFVVDDEVMKLMYTNHPLLNSSTRISNKVLFENDGDKEEITNIIKANILKRKILPNDKKVVDIPKIQVYSVKDYMKKEGYISVHKTVRANSKHFLYTTFIKENNSSINVYISKKASISFYEGQVILKGFFDDLLIAKVNEKIKLVSSTDYSQLNLS